MLKKLRYVLLCMCLYYFIPIHYCDSELKSYRNEVMEMVEQYCPNKQYNNPQHQYIYFKRLKNYEIGECQMKFNTYKILIDPVFWKTASEQAKFETFVHEAGHCLLFKTHVDNPRSYMYYMLNGLSRETVRAQFIEDLRSKCGR